MNSSKCYYDNKSEFELICYEIMCICVCVCECVYVCNVCVCKVFDVQHAHIAEKLNVFLYFITLSQLSIMLFISLILIFRSSKYS